jgi:RHS repeat-associated protein
VAVTTGGTSAGSYYGYDALGQTLRRIQQTDSVNYLTDATYNKAGAMLTETYPVVPGAADRRTVNYTFDTAGRLSALASAATTYAPAASVSSISYAPHGALASETLGNNLIHALVYNNRLQPTQIKLGTAALPTSVLSLTYNYGTTANNGNVLSTTYAGGGLSYTQNFGYDALNRLTTSSEGASWSQTNSYDRYGNRSILGGGLTFNAANNRISTAGYVYDASGNLTNDTLHIYTFDAENKISKVDAVSAYTYNGEGQRVRKLVGENTRFVYGVGGQLVAEFNGSNVSLMKEYAQGGATLITIEPTAVNSNGTRYTTSDHLGSPRVVTNSSAGVVSRHDYMPFGVELDSGVGGRTPAMGFSVADGLRQKFTSKERDIETGLDFFGARYYASTHGRFTSADPLLASARTWAPQSWNRYSYVLNNPLKLIDPNGLKDDDPQKKGEEQKGQKRGGQDCGQVKIEAKIDQPTIVQNKTINDVNGKTLKDANGKDVKATGVEGGIVFTVTVNGQPAADVKVTETNQNTDTKNGSPISSTLEEGKGSTNADGPIGDKVAMYQTTDGSKETNNKIKADFSNNTWTSTDNQTLTLTFPRGGVCSATSTRTLTNAGPNGPSSKFTITTTKPVVKPDN